MGKQYEFLPGLISVVVPVYNVEKYLPQSLDSLLGQSYSNLEVICVNDGSTDRSLDILEEYALKDSRIKVVSQKNSGLGSARNTGLNHASGEFVGFIDSDDWVNPLMYETMLEVIATTKTDFVACAMTVYNDKEQKNIDNLTLEQEDFFYLKTFDDNLERTAIDVEILRETFFRANVSACNKLFRREFIEGSKLRFLEGIFYEDLFFYVDLIKKVTNFSFIKEKFYNYRKHRLGAITQAHHVKDRIESLCYIYEVNENTTNEEEVFINPKEFWKYAFHWISEVVLDINRTQQYSQYSLVVAFLKDVKKTNTGISESLFLQYWLEQYQNNTNIKKLAYKIVKDRKYRNPSKYYTFKKLIFDDEICYYFCNKIIWRKKYN